MGGPASPPLAGIGWRGAAPLARGRRLPAWACVGVGVGVHVCACVCVCVCVCVCCCTYILVRSLGYRPCLFVGRAPDGGRSRLLTAVAF